MKKVNEHINTTVDMLKMINFPQKLEVVREYASNHHEKIDGSGYPRGIKGSDMSIPAKILAMADTLEAITSSDKPYRVPNKLSECVKIMSDMVKNNKFDKDIFNAMLKSRALQEYAEQYMKPEQIDEFDVEQYLVP